MLGIDKNKYKTTSGVVPEAVHHTPAAHKVQEQCKGGAIHVPNKSPKKFGHTIETAGREIV